MPDLTIHSPMQGWAAPLDEVPDPVFAERMLGDGLAVDPTLGELRAPCDGTIVSVHRARHAVTLRAANGAELLMHIGLETVGLEPGHYIEVDDTLRVPGSDWLYAVGDVNGRVLLTHQGKYQARAAGDVIAARSRGEVVADQPWGRHVATADHAAVPQVVFSEPEVASVGLTADAARAAGHEIEVVDYDLGWVAGSSLHADGYQGQARMIVDTEREVLLGVTFVGADVAELLQAATIAVTGEVPISRLWHAVPAYPTMNEVWLRLLEAYGRQSA